MTVAHCLTVAIAQIACGDDDETCWYKLNDENWGKAFHNER